MFAYEADINFHFGKKKFLIIEKVMTNFSIFKKMFAKLEKLTCGIRLRINQTHINKLFKKIMSVF